MVALADSFRYKVLMSNDLGSRLSTAREKKGLRHEAVAAACNVTAQTVRNWEEGKGSPRFEHAKALCEVLGVSPHWLVFGREKGRAA